MCTMTHMGRTNVVVDDELVAKVMRIYGLRTKREAIDFALRKVAGSSDRRAMLELEGIGWEGDLLEMRRGEPIEELRSSSTRRRGSSSFARREAAST
jgi:Arc/MetJ family transcription regulator